MRFSTETTQVVAGFVPIDMQAGANDGDWVSLKKFRSCTILFFKAAGTAPDDPTLLVEQAENVAGLNAKGLDFTDIFVKQGTLSSIGQFTRVTQTASNTYTEGTAAEKELIWIITLDVVELDINNGFSTLRARVADTGGNAQLGAILYLLTEPRVAKEPLDSVIVD